MISMNIFSGDRTLSIMPTYRCNASCNNCGSLSSPTVDDSLSLTSMLRVIKEAKEIGFKNVVFTGGEPTLRWKDLKKVIQFCTDLGLPSRVVSNAYWATSVNHAKAKISELIDCGLREINFSTGDEHVKFVPVQRVVNALVASIGCEIVCSIAVEYRKERSITKNTILDHKDMVGYKMYCDDKFSINESPWMPLNPLENFDYLDGLTANEDNIDLKRGCESVLQTTTVQATGKIGACCGIGMRKIPELTVSQIDEPDCLKNAIKNAESDMLKLLIHYMGPEKIIAWTAKKDSSIKWQNMYAHRCQACIRMYKDPKIKKVIKEHYTELLTELVGSIILDEYYTPNAVNSP